MELLKIKLSSCKIIKGYSHIIPPEYTLECYIMNKIIEVMTGYSDKKVYSHAIKYEYENNESYGYYTDKIDNTKIPYIDEFCYLMLYIQ